MTTMVVVAIVVVVLAFIGFSGSSKPVSLPAPGGPETLGPMRTLPTRNPIAPAPDSAAIPPGSGLYSLSVAAIGPNKIEAIKYLRDTRLLCDLRTAKALTENLPQPLFRDLPAADAERVRRYLAAGGITLRIESNGAPATSLAADVFQPQTVVRPAPTSAAHDKVNDLERLEQMRQNGVLTDAEFTRMKAEILGKSGSPFQ